MKTQDEDDVLTSICEIVIDLLSEGEVNTDKTVELESKNGFSPKLYTFMAAIVMRQGKSPVALKVMNKALNDSRILKECPHPTSEELVFAANYLKTLDSNLVKDENHVKVTEFLK